MPLNRIVCPHCEQIVELQSTSVTRSRPCPNCGKNIILQLVTREGKQRRQALLTQVTEPAEEGIESPGAPAVRRRVLPSAEPVPLRGDPHKRLMHDPEVQKSARLLTWGLIIFGGLLLVIVSGNSLHWWNRIEDAASRSKELFRAPADPGEQPAESVIAPKVTPANSSETPSAPPNAAVGPKLTDHDTAKDAVLRFLGALGVDERLGLVRDRALNEKRIREYYAAHPDGPVAFERVEALDVNPLGVYTYSFSVVLTDGTRRNIMVGKARAGDYLVDWASFVLYGEMEWADFITQRPRSPKMFRVLAAPGEYFSGEFADSRSWLCVKLANPADLSAAPLYGYVKKDVSLGRILKDVVAKGGGVPVPLMLKLSFPEQVGTGNQVWINEFIGEGWIARNW